MINILDEQSDTGSIMQEDETTVATTHGDEFLLEDATALLRGGKLSVETQTIALEDDTSIGSMLKTLVETHGFQDLLGLLKYL